MCYKIIYECLKNNLNYFGCTYFRLILKPLQIVTECYTYTNKYIYIYIYIYNR